MRPTFVWIWEKLTSLQRMHSVLLARCTYTGRIQSAHVKKSNVLLARRNESHAQRAQLTASGPVLDEVPLLLSFLAIHTHTHIYIYIYITMGSVYMQSHYDSPIYRNKFPYITMIDQYSHKPHPLPQSFFPFPLIRVTLNNYGLRICSPIMILPYITTHFHIPQ